MAVALFGNLLKTRMVTREDAMPGSPTPQFRVPERHAVLGTPLRGPWADSTQVLYVAMGCFWGAERTFWRQPGVVTTAAGYMGGFTENPTYEDTLTGRTGHTETVMVAYDPQQTSAEQLLKVFWESHDPTQGMRQGNDVGTTYRSAVYWTTDEQRAALERTQAAVEPLLRERGYGAVTTEERPAAEAGTFWYAEGYHQQYLEKNPGGYCGLGGTGVTCPVGVVGA